MKISGGPLDNQTCQTEWKTATLDKAQLCEYENQTLEAFVAVSHLSAKFDCPVARQNFSLLATAHDCETGLYMIKEKDVGSPWFPRSDLAHRDSFVCRSVYWCYMRRLTRLIPSSTISTLPPCCKLQQRIVGKIPGHSQALRAGWCQCWIQWLSTRSGLCTGARTQCAYVWMATAKSHSGSLQMRCTGPQESWPVHRQLLIFALFRAFLEFLIIVLI